MIPDRTLFIDISELFGQFAHATHPTGISRVIVNLADTLGRRHGEVFRRVVPIFWDPIRRRPMRIDWNRIGGLAEFFPGLAAAYASAGLAHPPLRSGLRKGIVTTIPKPLRFRLFPHLHGVTHFLAWANRQGLRPEPVAFAAGDCLFAPGSFWLDGYAPALADRARRAGAAVVAFVHDVLLLSHPELLAPHHAAQFRRGMQGFLPRCAAIVCNSRNTRDELAKFPDLAPDIPVAVCRLADSPSSARETFPLPEIAGLSGRRYVLLVSTVTPRKNHRLAVAAWQELWRKLGDATPWLVLAGGGTPDAALAALLAKPESFGNRIVRMSGVDDATLESLYAHAWLTVYPSLGEGYGLPAAEALARGKVCLATACGGLAEVAPGLIDPIDHENPRSLVERLVSYVDHPERLAADEAAVRSRYRPTRWEETARTVRTVLEQAAG